MTVSHRTYFFPMIFLRIFSVIAAGFVLFASPFVLLSQRQALNGGWALALGALAVAVFAFGYLFFALFAHRFARSARVRLTGALLLAFQLVTSAVVLGTSNHAQTLVSVAAMLCYSVGLFLAFIWPGETARVRRPMRRRDNSDHYLSS